MTEEIITIKNLTRTFTVPVRGEGVWEALKGLVNRKYEKKHAVKKITFSVRRGEILGLLGPNGAGKSTTIKMLTGILKPTSGKVNVLGFDPFEERKTYTYHIGAIFGQKSQLWWDIPAMDSFRLSEHLYGLPREEYLARREKMIDLLNVRDVIGKPVRNLSLGERMKCEFIMAMLHNPELVFLDEPTIGMDVFAKETVREFIQYANKEFGTTFILTTHDMDDIEHLAHRVIVINHGMIVFDDTIKKLRNIAGNKKYVRVTGRDVLPEMDWNGITNFKRISTYEATMTLDRKKLPLDEFTKRVATSAGIQDLQVSDPDVEELIKKIYER